MSNSQETIELVLENKVKELEYAVDVTKRLLAFEGPAEIVNVWHEWSESR